MSIENSHLNHRCAIGCLSVLLASNAGAMEPGSAANGCASFHRNVAHELARMRAPASAVTVAEIDGNSAVLNFAVPPARVA
jgi:hypothetical protein